MIDKVVHTQASMIRRERVLVTSNMAKAREKENAVRLIAAFSSLKGRPPGEGLIKVGLV